GIYLRLLPRQGGIREVDLGLVGVVEEREEAIVFALGDGVVLVSLALRTADRQAEPDGTCGANAIDGGGEAELLDVDAALFVDHRVAMEPGGDALGSRRTRQQVAGDLFDRELVEGHVAV